MELRHLRYFVMAAQEENFHRAARKLHVVQPALSRQIRLLEEELDVTLFERLPHGVRLSDSGKVFLDGALKILASVESLIAEAKRAEKGQVGTLRIGFNEASARSPIVPGSFNAFRRDYPDVELSLTLAKSQAQLAALREDKLDAGFLFDRDVTDSNLKYLRIRLAERFLVLPKAHPLAARRRIKLADLAGEPFILMARSNQTVGFDRLMAACIAGGLSPRIIQEASDEQTIVHLVSVGMGLSFLISPDEKRLPDEVAVRKVTDLSVKMDLELVWMKSNHSRALALFVETVKALKDS